MIVDLGVVSLPAAARGVEVVASIDAGSSVTFRFRAEAAGSYALRVRHIGDGLTLEARGPSGSASIDPGPLGPFETLILPILEASYQIRASATADQPVFVDWELLLISGVGQAPALSPGLIGSPVSVPLPGPPAPAGVAAWNPTSISPPTTTPGPLAGPFCTSSTIGLGGPIGRPGVDRPIAPVGPATRDGSLSMALLGEGIPAGLSASRNPPRSVGDAPTSTASATTFRDAPGLADSDEAILDDASWWEGLALSLVPSISRDAPSIDESGEPIALETPTPADRSSEKAGLGSGLTIGLVSTIAMSRRVAFKADRKHPFRWGRPRSMGDPGQPWRCW